MKIFFLILLIPFVFVGCTSRYESLLINNISEARQFIYEGEDDGVKATFICGYREEDYVADGKTTPHKDFGVVTFDLEDEIEIDKTIAKFVLTIGTTRYDGVLVTNPFDGTLVADIGKLVHKEENATAKIIAGEFIKEIDLHLISDDWNVKYLDVVDIVVKNYKNEIKSFIKENVLNGEVYIKMIEGEGGDYYWYFNVIATDGDSMSLIISPYTKDILASNINIKND